MSTTTDAKELYCQKCDMKLRSLAEVFLHERLHVEPHDRPHSLWQLPYVLMPRVAELMQDYASAAGAKQPPPDANVERLARIAAENCVGEGESDERVIISLFAPAIAALRAENERLTAALEQVREIPWNVGGGGEAWGNLSRVNSIARKALAGSGEGSTR